MEPETDIFKKAETKFPKELHHVLDKVAHSCPAFCRIRRLGSYVVGSVDSLTGVEGAFDLISVSLALTTYPTIRLVQIVKRRTEQIQCQLLVIVLRCIPHTLSS